MIECPGVMFNAPTMNLEALPTNWLYRTPAPPLAEPTEAAVAAAAAAAEEAAEVKEEDDEEGGG